MLDLKRIRNNPEEIKELMADRGENFDLSVIDEVVALDKKRRDMLTEVEELKNRRNTQSAIIPKLKKSGENVEELMIEMKKTFR
jgi:seryl-tRNA synthetase